MARFTTKDFEEIVFATHTGMTTEAFHEIAVAWTSRARDHRWKRPFTELVYQPMQEVLRLLHDNGFRTAIVTGGGQDFVRAYADRVYGIPPEQIIGSALETRYAYDDMGKAMLVREPKVLLDNNFSGKAEDIYLFTGRRPQAAFGNSTGDRQMLEYAHGGPGPRLAMLVLHDDADREYAYGPANGLLDSKVGTFTQELFDEAKLRGWQVISMRNDWKRLFAWSGLETLSTRTTRHAQPGDALMNKRLSLYAVVTALLGGGVAVAQYPIMDMVADEVIEKYRGATCEELWEMRDRPKSERAKEAIQLLRDDPQMRAAFIDKVAAPIVNKMFECGLVP
jgi:hypothetical protein